MKLTSVQLRRIIKEEVQKVLAESEQSIVRHGDELYLVDDEGNESFYETLAGSEYEDVLEDGESAPFQGSRMRGSYSGSRYSSGGGYKRRRY